MTSKRLKLSMRHGKSFDLTIKQAARAIGYNPQTIQKLANSGQIRAVKRFRRWYFSKESLLEFVKSRTTYNQG